MENNKEYQAAVDYYKSHCLKHEVTPIVFTNSKNQIEFWFQRKVRGQPEFYGLAEDVLDILTLTLDKTLLDK